MTLAYRSLCCVLTSALIVAAAGCSSSSTSPTSSAPDSQTDLVVGTGATAAAGNRVTVSYTGWLYDSTQSSGKGRQFDSSSSFPFFLGTGAVIKGWDQGVVGMRVGGQRRLIIPPELAYGSSGSSNGVIPPNATLMFEITLLGVG
jgi:FKBP-type peptidyl-prolyl cis-trans isomerase